MALAPLFSCTFLLCSQVIKFLLYSLKSTFILYPTSAARFPWCSPCFPKLHLLLAKWILLQFSWAAVAHLCVPGLPVWLHCTDPWHWDMLIYKLMIARLVELVIYSIQKLKAFILTLGNILRKLIAHQKAFCFLFSF